MHKPGGGPSGRQVTKQPVKSGPGARAVNIAWPATVGNSRANRVQGSSEGGVGKVLRGVRPSAYQSPSFNPVRQGNEVATNVGRGGPGAGRTLYGQSGQQ